MIRLYAPSSLVDNNWPSGAVSLKAVLKEALVN